MQLLPSLTVGACAWHLPLAEPVAWGLCAALLEEPQPRRRRLKCLLRHDPPLALWAVCRAQWEGCRPHSVAELAGWLSLEATAVLHWTGDRLPAAEPPAPETRRPWAALAASSVDVARAAAELAAAELAGEATEENRFGAGPDAAVDEGPEQAYLCGLLHGALQWLASSGPAVSPADCLAGRSCLPGWLVQWLEQIVRPTASRSAPAWVAQVLADRATAPSPGPDCHRLPSEAVESGGTILRRLTVRLQRLQQLEDQYQDTLEQEKLAALKELAYGASHEINNPLANISTRAQTLLRDEPHPERRRMLATINSQAFRAHEMISDMMLFARPPQLQLQPLVDLGALVDQVFDELRADAEEQGTTLERSPDEPSLTLTADPTHLAVAVKALCANALQAVSVGGRVEVSVRTTAGPPHNGDPPDRDSDRDSVEIIVHDTGPGIPPEVRRHLFDPFYSGREAGRGLGLGLSKCWRIVTLHGGRIDVQSDPRQGTRFVIKLPRHAAEE